MDLRSQVAGIGALADDTRRSLYEYVVAQPAPVSRDQASAALGLAKHTVSFHLDRLAAEGLLDVEFRRLSGRSGPGAGRPNKLYRRSERDFAVTLPPRRYDLVGDILAAAVGRTAGGSTLQEALAASAHDEGRELGRTAAADPREGQLATLAAALTDLGFEPVSDAPATVLVLANCPFHALAQKHTDVVCGVNRHFVQGVADGLGCTGVTAHLEPDPPNCCVKARAEAGR